MATQVVHDLGNPSGTFLRQAKGTVLRQRKWYIFEANQVVHGNPNGTFPAAAKTDAAQNPRRPIRYVFLDVFSAIVVYFVF